MIFGWNIQWTVWVVELGPGIEIRTEGVGVVVILPKLMGKALQGVKFPREIVKMNKNKKTPYICMTVIFRTFFPMSFDLTAIQ